MIVITGGAGFIGRNLVDALKGMYDVVIVDNNFDRIMKMYNEGYDKITYLTPEDSYLWLDFNAPKIDFVYHLGARTDTMEMDEEIFEKLNLTYSMFIWKFCTEQKIPLIYASSAAVYGDGSFGFSDEMETDWDYYPLNPYGESKYWFDMWVRDQIDFNWGAPPHWWGFRFFNVYGPHEEHKNKMASVVYQLYNQIKETGGVKLFKSHRDECEDGEQMRDFIYVKDVVNVMFATAMSMPESGIYNLGTGKARTYNDLAKAVFKSLGKEANISYIDMPEEIREKYQYFTEAEMDKLRKAGYPLPLRNIEYGVDDYIKYLENENC